MNSREKAREKGNTSPGARAEFNRYVVKTAGWPRHSPEPPAIKNWGARLPLQRLSQTLFGKSRRKDKIIDGPNNSD
jgi:hypothetical protein